MVTGIIIIYYYIYYYIILLYYYIIIVVVVLHYTRLKCFQHVHIEYGLQLSRTRQQKKYKIHTLENTKR